MNRFVPLHEEIFLKSADSEDLSALICDDEHISFSELDQCSSDLAWQLQQTGTGSGSMVGIYLNPSVNLAISILAVLKTGAAYVPLSPAFPQERIRYILQDAGARLVITDDLLPHTLFDNHTHWLIPDWSDLKNRSEKRIPETRLINPSDCAYILYTSGSSGNPKGVIIEHRNLNYYIHWFCEHVMPETGVTLPLTSSFIFAAAVTQFYSTLLSGKTLHILDPLLIRKPGELMEWYSSHPGMGLYCVPTLWSEILYFLETKDAAVIAKMAPSCVYLSGEVVTDELLKKTFRLLPDLQLWNLYGPTEATANLTASRLYPGEPANIGKPLEGTKIYITDDDLNMIQPGETGELLASGEGIGRGYLNLTELTGTTFITLKLNGRDPVRVYRTGDLVKEDELKRLIYIGRKDQQVKIRGFRIELPEIEQALLAVPDVKHAIVKVVEDVRNGKRLGAYLIYKGNDSQPVDELRKILRRTLPDFMIPEVFVTMEQFPQLPNGKFDRKSLPAPGVQRPDLGYPVLFPLTADEKKMIRIWEEVIGVEGIGMEDNFFDLGGNSLKANALVMELQTRMGVSVLIKSIFDYPSPVKLLMHIFFNHANQSGEPAIKLGTISYRSDIPESLSKKTESDCIMQSGLSENQKALWFIQQTEPKLSAYNIFYTIKLTGMLDIESLRYALLCITGKHESMKTAFHFNNGQPQRIINIPDNLMPEIFIPQHDSLYVTVPEVLDHARSVAALPFNLELGPPYRFILYKIREQQHLLAFIVHHIVFDGFSFDILLRELSFFYDNANNGSKSGWSIGPAAYTQFIREERLYMRGMEYSDDKQYWQKQLVNVPTFFEIPTDFRRPEIPSWKGGQVRREISPILRTRIRTLSDTHGSSMFMTCLAAFSVLLYFHSGRTDFLIGSPVANRSKKSFLNQIGYFVNTILLRAKVDPDLSFADWLGSVKDLILENLFHSRFPFSHLIEVLKAERIPGINPFFQVMFAFHETQWEFLTNTGISGTAREEFSVVPNSIFLPRSSTGLKRLK